MRGKLAKRFNKFRANLANALKSGNFNAIVKVQAEIISRAEEHPNFKNLAESVDFVIDGITSLMCEKEENRPVRDGVRVPPLPWDDALGFLDNKYDIIQAEINYKSNPQSYEV